MKFECVRPKRKIREQLIKHGWKLAHKGEGNEYYTENGEYDRKLSKGYTIQLYINSVNNVWGAVVWSDGVAEHGEIYDGIPML